jgi:hypothetical protein
MLTDAARYRGFEGSFTSDNGSTRAAGVLPDKDAEIEGPLGVEAELTPGRDDGTEVGVSVDAEVALAPQPVERMTQLRTASHPAGCNASLFTETPPEAHHFPTPSQG